MKPVTRCISLILLLTLLMPGALALTNEEEQTPPRHTAPEGFEFLDAPKNSISKHHTAIRIPGFEPAVYAYLDRSGGVIYLVYGRLEKKKGMYEAELNSSPKADELLLSLHIIGDEPHKTTDAKLGRPRGVKLNAATLPEGYRQTGKTGVCYFTNIFGDKEYRVLGRIEGRPDTYYPAQYGKPRPGGLPIDISRDRERFLHPGEKKQKLPREYKNGFATAVLVLTKQAEWVSVLTDKPILNME